MWEKSLYRQMAAICVCVCGQQAEFTENWSPKYELMRYHLPYDFTGGIGAEVLGRQIVEVACTGGGRNGNVGTTTHNPAMARLILQCMDDG